MKKRSLKFVFNASLFFAALYFFSFLLFNIIQFFGNDGPFRLDWDVFFSKSTALVFVVSALLSVLFFVFLFEKKCVPKNLEAYLKDGKKDPILANLEQSRFLTNEEITKNFRKIEYNELPDSSLTGIPIKAEMIGAKYDIHLANDAHTMVIGSTGSGKTTSLINPTIQILANSNVKPSLLIADPKGELFSLHAKSLENKGYEVKVLDLRNPYNSTKWNPLEKVYLRYQKMINLEDEVEVLNVEKRVEKKEQWDVFSFLQIKNEEEISTNQTLGVEKQFKFNEKIFTCEEALNKAIKIEKQKLYDTIYEDCNDFVSILCPVKNKKDPIWESGAKNFILAIILAMLEDSEKPELGMSKEKFNFYNVAKIASNTQNDCKDLKHYFNNRDNLSKARALSKQVLDSLDRTRGSYLSTIFDRLSLFSDLSVCSLTSANEIDFTQMAASNIALFLQSPDEKETRNILAAMMILQAYKELVATANLQEDFTLVKPVYFILDEFGNLPAINKLEQMITVGRSRKIWLYLVLQSYSQLSKVYDDKVADIIKSNCNIQMFIGTTDNKTLEEFSKRCGNYSVMTKAASESGASDAKISSSASIKERPLIYPSDLSKLNSPGDMGNAVVTVFGYHPILSKFTPSFACPTLNLEHSKQNENEALLFDEQKVFYDINLQIQSQEIDKIYLLAQTEIKKEFPQEDNNIMSLIQDADELAQSLLTKVQRSRLAQYIKEKNLLKALGLLETCVKLANEKKKEYLIQSIDSLRRRIDNELSVPIFN